MSQFRFALFLAALSIGLLTTSAYTQSTGGPQSTDGPPCLPTDATCRPNGSGLSDRTSTKLDPKFRFLKQILDSHGRASAVFGPDGAPADLSQTHVGATLRFVDKLSDRLIADFESRGITFVRDDGEPVHVGAVYLALVDWAAFEFLAEHPLLVRAESTWRPVMAAPLEVTSETTGAAYAHRLPEMSVDGEGVTVADIDSGFDVLHPHLFRADGGYYTWQDTDENGRFDAGADLLDHDGDGSAEKLRVLDGARIVGWDELENADEQLQPRYDWVYLDLNDDGERNAGPSQGFAESDPAYGEPIFVVDDVDTDGVLEPGEKLVRLKTSKFRKITFNGNEYVRGDNLIDAADDSVNLQPGHGTSVASVLGGGQKGFHDYVGLAPGVDILGYAYGRQDAPDSSEQQRYSTQMSAIADAIDEGAALILHEWTNLVWVAADGSSNLEYAMDEARAEGVVQVNPLGNLNQSGKHISRTVGEDEYVDLEFNVSGHWNYGQQAYPFSAVYISLFWRNSASSAPLIRLINPTGVVFNLNFDRSTQAIGAASAWGDYEFTSRGTAHAPFILWREDRESLMQGDWTIRVRGLEPGAELTARVTDMYSSWARGVEWTEPTSDHGTLVFPSSADSAFGVAAFGGRHAMTYENQTSEAGELRQYSGRGPRIDGARGVDIAAPDDPYAAQGINARYQEAGYRRGWFSTFGGTSGAGPHVAAGVALLEQQHPDWTPDQIEDQLQQSAQDDALLPGYGDYPNPHWGYGKLDIFKALYGIARPSPTNLAPIASLDVSLAWDSVTLDATDSADPDGDALEYRFDFDYDGKWDTGWIGEPTVSSDLGFFDEDLVNARVSVRDPSGERAGALVAFDVSDAPPPEIVVHETEQKVEDGGCQCDSSVSGRGAGAKITVVMLGLLALARIRRALRHS